MQIMLYGSGGNFGSFVSEMSSLWYSQGQNNGGYKIIFGESKFREIINSEDNELGFLLGIGPQFQW